MLQAGPYESRVVDDTGAIITGLPRRLYTTHYTTPSVILEVKDPQSRAILEEALSTGRLQVLDPAPEYVEKAKTIAGQAGVLSRLSRTDIEVLALALQLALESGHGKTYLATDDLRLQEAAEKAGLKVIPIRYRRRGRRRS